MKIIHEINGEKSLFYYQNNFLTSEEYNLLRLWLDTKEFIAGRCVSGKEIPREQLWFQENGEYFCKKWNMKYDRWKSNPYEQELSKIQNKISEFTKSIKTDIFDNSLIQTPNINSCLINKYRTGSDSIKPHRDTSISFGIYPTIIGLSVGSERNMVIKKINYDPENVNSLKHDTNTELNLDITLEDNSLFVMAGASQKYFTHEIPKSDDNDIRYSLTFREFIY
jgi:alkylated DNA repair dioxygenase AlkB